MGNCFSCNKRGRVEHFRPRRKEVIPNIEHCDLCGVVSWDVQYCSVCHKWLCPKCAKDPVKRFKGMLKDKVLKKKKLYE